MSCRATSRVTPLSREQPPHTDPVELHAVYTAPEGAIVAPKVVPPPEPTTEQLTCAVDDLDRAIRPASPLVADVLLGIPAPDGTSVSRQDVG